MRRIPRDLSGRAVVRALETVGYRRIRQVGSHIRLERPGEPVHRVTVPDHNPVPVGTLTGILADVASNLNVTRDELLDLLFG